MITVVTTVNFAGTKNTVCTFSATNLLNEKHSFSYHDYMGFGIRTHNSQGHFAYAQATYKF